MSAVEIFTPPTPCMSCRYVKRWLTRRGIEYVEKPMTDEVRDEFFERGFREFPVVAYAGRAFSGMHEADLKRLADDWHYFEDDAHPYQAVAASLTELGDEEP